MKTTSLTTLATMMVQIKKDTWNEEDTWKITKQNDKSVDTFLNLFLFYFGNFGNFGNIEE